MGKDVAALADAVEFWPIDGASDGRLDLGDGDAVRVFRIMRAEERGNAYLEVVGRDVGRVCVALDDEAQARLAALLRPEA